MSQDLKKREFQKGEKYLFVCEKPREDEAAWASGKIVTLIRDKDSPDCVDVVYFECQGKNGMAWTRELYPVPVSEPQQQPLTVTVDALLKALNENMTAWPLLLRHARVEDLKGEITRRRRLADAQLRIEQAKRDLEEVTGDYERLKKTLDSEGLE